MLVWDTRVRYAAWICFGLFFIPLGLIVYYGLSGNDSANEDFLTFSFVILLNLFIVLMFASFGIGWLEQRSIRKKGTLAPATVLGVSDTGVYINSQPVFKFELDVHPPYDEPFHATTEFRVPFSGIPQVQPGAQLQVYYIPGTKEVVIAE
jgi:hypothetical protein